MVFKDVPDSDFVVKIALVCLLGEPIIYTPSEYKLNLLRLSYKYVDNVIAKLCLYGTLCYQFKYIGRTRIL